jgi:hypothetical protein
MMPPLDEFARRRLGRALVSLEGAIARFEAHGNGDAEPSVSRLRRLADDIRAVLRLAHDNPARP